MSIKGSLDLVKAAYSKKFEDSFLDLNQDEQRLAFKKCNLWHDSPDHPSLRFKNWSGHVPARYKNLNPKYFRVSSSIRVFVIQENTNSPMVMEFVGRHDDYERFIRKS
jgi:hypothetical protein